MWSLVVILLASYFLGSIPGALWSSKALHGVDIRNYGSHNCGATNAFRVVGWQAGALATVVDFGKGFVSAGVVAPLIRIDPIPSTLALFGGDKFVVLGLLAGIMAVVGHMYPIFARFAGGKGVNTAAGMLFALTPITMAITLAVFAAVLLSSRYVSLASITSAVAFPTLVAIRRYAFGVELDPSLLVFGALLALAIVVAHRSNIQRLLDGTESQISSFAPAQGMLGRGEL
ncbi:MAG: glycerol-3-phosphate 1-O-acyltransferase PlsY [Salinibacter sp.]